PSSLAFSVATYPVVDFDLWSDALLVGVEPLYVSEDGTEIAAATFPVGSGFVAILAYDWYPSGTPDDVEARLGWNIVLQWLTHVEPGVAPAAPVAPTLPDAGAETAQLLAGAAVLVLL